jgi:cobalamin-dependent methionine synthase I
MMPEILGMQFEVDVRQVLSQLGLAPGEAGSVRVNREATEAIEIVRNESRTGALYEFFDLRANGRFAFLDGRFRLNSKRLYHVFKHCDRVAVFVSTLGSGLDRVITEAVRERPHFGAVLDAAASVAAECAADRLTERVRDQLGGDEGLTMRYSPGYCDWPLEEQRILFDLLPENPVGVPLSEDCLMSPKKSISGVLGVGPHELVRKWGNACEDCGEHDCLYRRDW